MGVLTLKIGAFSITALSTLFFMISSKSLSIKIVGLVMSVICLAKSLFLFINVIQLHYVWNLSYNQKILEIVQDERNGIY